MDRFGRNRKLSSFIHASEFHVTRKGLLRTTVAGKGRFYAVYHVGHILGCYKPGAQEVREVVLVAVDLPPKLGTLRVSTANPDIGDIPHRTNRQGHIETC